MWIQSLFPLFHGIFYRHRIKLSRFLLISSFILSPTLVGYLLCFRYYIPHARLKIKDPEPLPSRSFHFKHFSQLRDLDHSLYPDPFTGSKFPSKLVALFQSFCGYLLLGNTLYLTCLVFLPPFGSPCLRIRSQPILLAVDLSGGCLSLL